MSCNITKGLDILACKNTVAGIRRLYLSNWDDYDFVLGTASAQEITDLGTLGTASVFQYEVKNDGNSWAETSEGDRNTGTTVFNQVTTAVLTKLTAEKQYQLKLMSWGRLLVFVEFNSGDILVSGLENGCEATFASNVEGAMNGANAYTLTLTGMESESAYFLTDSAKTALKVLVSSDNMNA